MVFFRSKWRISFAENIFMIIKIIIIILYSTNIYHCKDSKAIFRIKDKLNWSEAVFFLTLSFLNWREMQIIQRASPAERDEASFLNHEGRKEKVSSPESK